MSKRLFEQTSQMRNDEQAAATIEKTGENAYPALAGGTIHSIGLDDTQAYQQGAANSIAGAPPTASTAIKYDSNQGFGGSTRYGKPGSRFTQVAQVRTTEQDGTVDEAQQEAYPALEND